MAELPERPDPAGAALSWVSRIMAVSLVMVGPGLGAQWLDKRLGTNWLTPIGFGGGLVVGFLYLLAVTGAFSRRKPGDKSGSSQDTQR